MWVMLEIRNIFFFAWLRGIFNLSPALQGILSNIFLLNFQFSPLWLTKFLLIFNQKKWSHFACLIGFSIGIAWYRVQLCFLCNNVASFFFFFGFNFESSFYLLISYYLVVLKFWFSFVVFPSPFVDLLCTLY